MKLLLDSHVFIWWMQDSLPAPVRNECMKATNPVLISAASVWEMQIKQDLGKLKLGASVHALVNEQVQVNGLELLPIKFEHIWALADLPRYTAILSIDS